MEVVGVGVKTRARAALAMVASVAANSAPQTVVKRRKIKITNDELKSSSSALISNISTISVETEDSSFSPSSDQLPSSCCSSNRSIELDEKRRSPVDLEVESAEVETSTSNCSRERREMSPSYELRKEIDQQESTKKPPSERNCIERSSVQKMPTELEIEEFFMAAEKDIQNFFEEKYNYDIVKDVPLEGRYEWVPLKQKQ